MANVAIYDPAQNNRVLTYLVSVHTPDYTSNPDAIINPDISAVSGIETKYWKFSGKGTSIVEMPQEEKDVIDAEMLSQTEKFYAFNEITEQITTSNSDEIILSLNVTLPKDGKYKITYNSNLKTTVQGWQSFKYRVDVDNINPITNPQGGGWIIRNFLDKSSISEAGLPYVGRRTLELTRGDHTVNFRVGKTKKASVTVNNSYLSIELV